MAYIYKITNLINNKVYIGETIGEIRIRWNQHKSTSFNPNSHSYNYHIHCAIRKYGIDNFKIEEIEQCTDEERFKRETCYILLYESYKPEKGYNYIIEGEGPSPYLTQDFLDYWEKGFQVKEIAKKIGCHKETVSKRLHANGISHEEIIKRFGEYVSQRDGKPVQQYSLTGEYIKTYPSTASCEKDGYSQSAISSVCRQVQKSAYGYLWKYENDERNIQEWVTIYNNKLSAGRPKKRTGQYDIETNELIKIFDSASEAARSLGLTDKTCICAAARKGSKSHGYKWRYLEN